MRNEFEYEDDFREQKDVTCKNCAHRFFVAKSLEGGLVNCPQCQKLVEVSSSPEPAFWLLVSVAVFVGLIITAAVFVFGGVIAGFITLVVCAALIGLMLVAL